MLKTLTPKVDFHELHAHFLTSLKVGVSFGGNWKFPTRHRLNRSDYVLVVMCCFRLLRHPSIVSESLLVGRFYLSISARNRVLHSVCIIDKISKFFGNICPTLFKRTL
ncbi:hypothetical protein AABB24_032771 [Solanum stoloniferum]|uniref:Uncharacterized protein n=1 Tax=Solanum stoloniferum TaxID=62892 RepID=A0ABD2RMM3_9SOLN